MYAGDVVVKGDALSFDAIDVDWSGLAACSAEIVPVIRANVRLAHLLERAGVDAAVSACVGAFRGFAARARAKGKNVLGLQIDFDCPTESLPFYGRWLAALRAALPNKVLSITVLPT